MKKVQQLSVISVIQKKCFYPQKLKPVGAGRSTPAQTRATLKPSEIRRRFDGANIVPPPCRRASPSYNANRLCLLPALPCGRSGRKPFINGSKGAVQRTPRGRALRRRKKCKRPCLHFFL